MKWVTKRFAKHILAKLSPLTTKNLVNTFCKTHKTYEKKEKDSKDLQSHVLFILVPS
jgi:hypothetical protein